MQFCLLNTNCNDNNALETFYCSTSALLLFSCCCCCTSSTNRTNHRPSLPKQSVWGLHIQPFSISNELLIESWNVPGGQLSHMASSPACSQSLAWVPHWHWTSVQLRLTWGCCVWSVCKITPLCASVIETANNSTDKCSGPMMHSTNKKTFTPSQTARRMHRITETCRFVFIKRGICHCLPRKSTKV